MDSVSRSAAKVQISTQPPVLPWLTSTWLPMELCWAKQIWVSCRVDMPQIPQAMASLQPSIPMTPPEHPQVRASTNYVLILCSLSFECLKCAIHLRAPVYSSLLSLYICSHAPDMNQTLFQRLQMSAATQSMQSLHCKHVASHDQPMFDAYR